MFDTPGNYEVTANLRPTALVLSRTVGRHVLGVWNGRRFTLTDAVVSRETATLTAHVLVEQVSSKAGGAQVPEIEVAPVVVAALVGLVVLGAVAVSYNVRRLSDVTSGALLAWALVALGVLAIYAARKRVFSRGG